MAHRRFSSIEQFRHVLADVTHAAQYVGMDAAGEVIYDKARPLPALTFKGTTKLHGTNCGIRLERGVVGWQAMAQSRERDVTPEDDHCGFAAWVQSLVTAGALRPVLDAALATARAALGSPADISQVTLFGEWVGTSVNAKAAVGLLSDRFVLFAVVVDYPLAGEAAELVLPLADVMAHLRAATPGLLPALASAGLYAVTDFKTWTVDIDFSDPIAALDLLESLTLEVEANCPVASAMGQPGMGEGIVWVHESAQYGRLCFKTKGLKHKGTRSKRLVEIAPEILESRQAFVNAVVTESRLEQGLAFLAEMRKAVSFDNVGPFLEWVCKDVMKEELDTLKASGLDKHLVMKAVGRTAREWYLERVDPLAV